MKSLKVVLLCVVACASIPLSAQKKLFKGKPLEVGLTLGASNYMGDLSKLVAVNETHPMGGLICRFNMNDWITLRGNAVFGTISADDKNFDSDAFRKQRNLNFRSNLVEFSGCIEYNLLGFEETQRGTPSTPYLFAGIGVFKYNPKTQFHYLATDPNGLALHDAALKKYDNQWIELQTLGTEGQETTKFNDRKRYPLTQISIPLGVGYKKQWDDVWAWGVEFGMRKTFTDYLDDVSKDYVDNQIVGGANGLLAAALKDRGPELGYAPFDNGMGRGNSSNKDWYMFLNFTITRKIVGGKTVCFQF
ncbi:MAG: hypothetical protein JNL57_00375 [Bacteroidetes bacterium]|nr:hypothetical protein [Bacteroidota bacterium]